jgi:Flp pilus assembly protein protease CpaA
MNVRMVSVSHRKNRPAAGLDRATWEREMRRLIVSNRLLSAVLVAVTVRMVVSGLTFASGFTVAIVAILLVASLLLTRHGHRLEPPPTSRRTSQRR